MVTLSTTDGIGSAVGGQGAGSFRYERKFLVDELDRHQIQAIVRLHPSMFVQPYPPRFINNIYLDTTEMEYYYDNVSGAGDRQKVRIRWYGEFFGRVGQPVLEFKIKRGIVGNKQQYRLQPFQFGPGFAIKDLVPVLQAGDLPDEIRARLLDLQAVLVNRYYRWYYATVDGRFRVTVDTGLTYYRVTNLDNTFAHSQVDHNNVVVELKYSAQDAGQAHRVSSYFPFRMTRNSKYVQGIERVFFQ